MNSNDIRQVVDLLGEAMNELNRPYVMGHEIADIEEEAPTLIELYERLQEVIG